MRPNWPTATSPVTDFTRALFSALCYDGREDSAIDDARESLGRMTAHYSCTENLEHHLGTHIPEARLLIIGASRERKLSVLSIGGPCIGAAELCNKICARTRSSILLPNHKFHSYFAIASLGATRYVGHVPILILLANINVMYGAASAYISNQRCNRVLVSTFRVLLI